MKLEVFHCRPDSGVVPVHPHPIVFVHGSFCGAWIWAERWMPYFAQRGFTSHALSLRGHGESEGQLVDASLEEYLEDVGSIMDRLGEPVILVGHSMGGLIVQHLLGRRTEDVKAAALISSVPPSGLGSSAAHLTTFAPDVLWQLGMLQNLGDKTISTEIIQRAFFSSKDNAKAAAHLLPKLQGESSRIGVELMAPPWPFPPSGARKVPVLVLGGDADVFLPLSAFHETAMAFEGDLRILKGAPHGILLDEAWWQPSADDVIDWLTKRGL